MTSLAEKRKKILKQLEALKIFSNTTTVRKLRQELNAKLQAIDKRAQKGRRAELPIPKEEIQKAANTSRAGKMRKYHNYLRQIRNSYPDLKYADIRQQFSERKRGKPSDIPDVVWFNPSP